MNERKTPDMPDASRTEFMAAYVAHQGRIYRYILTLVPNPGDAEEIFQQTSMTLWEKWDNFDPSRGVFPQWAFGFAHNHVRNFLRKQARRGPTYALSDEALDRIAALRREHDDEFEDRRDALAYCMDTLPERQRRIVEGYYDAGANAATIAESLGMTRAAMHKALQRVRRALHDCINRRLDDTGANE